MVPAGDHGPGFCTSPESFYFSARVPEGSYEVRLRLGNPHRPSVNTVKAEARRLLLMNHVLERGEVEDFVFMVNVRSPRISDTDSIRLKPREVNYMNWDNRLTLEFSGRDPAVHRIEIRPAGRVTTLYLAGNSTVTDQDYAPWASWGQMITRYFDTSAVVANYAESGASLASFKGRGRLDKVMSLIRPGDYLFIEFGHNDQKRKGEGIGPWDSFTELLREFVDLAQDAGASPVLLTPTQRRSFNKQGRIDSTHGDYPAAMKRVAQEMQVPLIDLNEMTRVLYEAWGPEDSRKAFVHYPAGTFPGQEEELKDNTHFNTFGAHEVALCVLRGILEQGIGLEDRLQHFTGDYHPETPSRPEDWDLPVSPRFTSTKPAGN
jgi:lysophospholipase L1-like esterase